MAKAKDRMSDAVDAARPYVERLARDEDLHDNVKHAYESARRIYDELLGDRGTTGVALKVARDKDVQKELRKAVVRAARAVEAARDELMAEQAAPIAETRQPELAGLLGREAEAAVVGRIADQQHGGVAALPGNPHGVAHQRAADAVLATNDRPRAGALPARSRCDGLVKRTGPYAASSSASRAPASDGFS